MRMQVSFKAYIKQRLHGSVNAFVRPFSFLRRGYSNSSNNILKSVSADGIIHYDMYSQHGRGRGR